MSLLSWHTGRTSASTTGHRHTQTLHRTNTSVLQQHRVGNASLTGLATSPEQETLHCSRIRRSVRRSCRSGLADVILRIPFFGRVNEGSTCCFMGVTSPRRIITTGVILPRLKELMLIPRVPSDHGHWFQTVMIAHGLQRRQHQWPLTMEQPRRCGDARSQGLCSMTRGDQRTSPMALINSTLGIHPQQAVSGRLVGPWCNPLATAM